MNKKVKLMSLFLTLGLACGVTAACTGGNNNNNNSVTLSESMYNAEMLSEAASQSTGYNSNLFYVNTLEFEVADPSVIYVSEGEEKGYFYAYGTSDEIGCHGFQAWRSKDLSHWECTGVAFIPDYDTAWAVNNYWAPEVIYDAKAKMYYMFYNAYNMNDYNRLCLSVAYSTSPAGPFRSPDNRKDANGNMLSASKPVFDLTTNNPVIAALNKTNPDMVKEHALDASPFIDPVSGDKYLYFSYYDDYGIGSFLYGMKMKDWLTPDYSTLTMISVPGYVSIEASKTGELDGRVTEGYVNEGPFMIYHEGKYYMTYSAFGYTDPRYRVKQAVSDSPLGVFEKISEEDGGIVISSDTANWNHIVSAGHHSFIQCGDELFIAYHTFKNRNSIAEGRALALDRIVWTKNAAGENVMHANGPTWSVQPLPEFLSGYKNIAPQATVTADNTAEGSDIKYLTDNLVKYQEFDMVTEYEAKGGTSTITFNWDTFKTVRGLMVYNSYDYAKTFVQIRKVELEYKTADGKTATAVINNLPFDWSWNCETDVEFMRPGGAAIAEFKEMPVKSVKLYIDSAAGVETLGISEIFILGNDQECAGVQSFENYSYTNAVYGSSHIENESNYFGRVKGTKSLATAYGYDLTHDDGTENAYIEQKGVSDQYAYFKDIYSVDFYAEAEFTVTASKAFSNDKYPKFGIAISCNDDYTNTIFYYVDAVNYTNTVVGCAQRKLDNSDWDWNASEQLVNVGDISYTGGNYVKLGVLRKGNEFYLLCNDKLAIAYDSFNIFNEDQKAAVGFLSFNTPMKIKNYSATNDAKVIEEMSKKYADSTKGETLGNAGMFKSTSGWDFSNDRGENPSATQTLGGDQYAYFTGVNATQFYVETEITVTQDMGDAFPKFGLVVRNESNTFFYYIDGSSNYAAKRVGFVTRKTATDWGWGAGEKYNAEAAVTQMGSYANGGYVKLGILRDGATFSLYVDDVLALTVSDIAGFDADSNAVAGILSFTTGISVKNYSITTDITGINK